MLEHVLVSGVCPVQTIRLGRHVHVSLTELGTAVSYEPLTNLNGMETDVYKYPTHSPAKALRSHDEHTIRQEIRRSLPVTSKELGRISRR